MSSMGIGELDPPGSSSRTSHPYWIFGLPIDCLSQSEAAARIHAAVRDRQKLVFATPNVNFLAEAQRSSAFAECILRTDMSVTDGFPLKWIGRITGTPVPMRVAGSS